MKRKLTPTRRDFLKTSAALTAPLFVSPSIFAKDGRPAPSDRVIVGSIGVGDLGRRHHLNGHLLRNPRVEVAAVCDVDAGHLAQAKDDAEKWKKKPIDAYKDFRDLCDRKDIDAVLIAVPDHWHALCAIYAMEAGKDVYCEKPLSFTVDEGKKMLATARRYGTVFQTGSQQRSDARFQQAVRLVRHGKIGKLQAVHTYIGDVEPGKWQAYTEPPKELDWNFWLGPAPMQPYFKDKVHYKFRWFADFSGGKMTDWGAHHNDIAQWGIGADGSGPTRVSGKGKFNPAGPHDVALDFDVDYTYANGVTLHCHAKGKNGIKFEGSDGWVFVNRGTIHASNEALAREKFPDDEFTQNREHHDNWIDCIWSRQKPICDVEVGFRSVTVCHLGNIAIRLGRELNWDPKAEQFVDDDEANRMLSRPMRSPWHV